MTHPKQTIRAALSQHRGDDLERAERAFRGMSEKQMQEPYGFSGKTRAQILEEYRQHARDVDAAMAWIDRAPVES